MRAQICAGDSRKTSALHCSIRADEGDLQFRVPRQPS
jgi:hypothetical protein